MSHTFTPLTCHLSAVGVISGSFAKYAKASTKRGSRKKTRLEVTSKIKRRKIFFTSQPFTQSKWSSSSEHVGFKTDRREGRQMMAREGGRCHRLEINMVERDTVARESERDKIRGRCVAELMVLGWGASRVCRQGVREHLRRSPICRTLHLTLLHHEFVKGNEAEEALTVISGCQLRSVSRSTS